MHGPMFPRILIESHCLKLVISNLLHLISDISAAVSWIMQTGGPLIVSVIKTKLIADDSNVTRRQDVGGFTLTWFRYHCQIMIRLHSCLSCCCFVIATAVFSVEHNACLNGRTGIFPKYMYVLECKSTHTWAPHYWRKQDWYNSSFQSYDTTYCSFIDYTSSILITSPSRDCLSIIQMQRKLLSILPSLWLTIYRHWCKIRIS